MDNKSMTIIFSQSPEAIANEIKTPAKAHEYDSGFDLFSPISYALRPGERATINLQIKFALPKELPVSVSLISNLGMTVEGQIRPKSGRSKAGLDVELGTIDNDYRGYVGVTVTNTTHETIIIGQNEKLCQLVFAPVFFSVGMVAGTVDAETERGTTGFGDSGLK